MNYADLYAIRAQKAVDSGLVDLEAMIGELRTMGVPDDRIDAMILDDLREGGPIFGKFFRSLGMAAGDTTAIAHRVASSVGMSVGLSEGVERLARAPGGFVTVAERTPGQFETATKASISKITGPLKIGDTDIVELAKQGDPEALEYLEDVTDFEALTWVCALRKTCAVCLPLHGKTMTRQDWRASGHQPGGKHPRCMCVFEPSSISANRKEHLAPLVRQVAPGQTKGGKRTVRAIGQADVERAIAAAEAAQQTPEGRKLIAELGSVNE